jgi:hypothetical protein
VTDADEAMIRSAFPGCKLTCCGPHSIYLRLNHWRVGVHRAHAVGFDGYVVCCGCEQSVESVPAVIEAIKSIVQRPVAHPFGADHDSDSFMLSCDKGRTVRGGRGDA